MSLPRRGLLRGAPLVVAGTLFVPTVSALTGSDGPRVDSGGRDAIYGATATPDGGVLAVGTRASREISVSGQDTSIPEGYALALEADGDVAWEGTYAGPVGNPPERQEDWLRTAVPRDEAGYLLLGVGYNPGPDAETGWVQAVDGNGDPVWFWSTREADTGNSFNDTLSDGVRTDGGFLLAGRTGGGFAFDDTGSDGWLVALAGDGTLRWHERYAASDTANGHDELRAVLPHPDGYLLVGERSLDGGGATAGWLVGVDAEGAVEFERTYRPRAGRNVLVDGARTADGGYLLAGTSYADESWNRRHYEPLPAGRGWLLGVDADGDRRLSRLLDGPSHLLATTSARGAGAFVAGARNGAGWVGRVTDGADVVESVDSADAVAFGGIAPLCRNQYVAAGWTLAEGESGGDGLLTTLRPGPNRFGVLTTDDAPRMTYEFTATGPVERITDAGRNAAEDNDAITERDGTVEVSGVTGSGYGDTFRVEGEVTAFSTDVAPRFVRLQLDGLDVTDRYLARPTRFVVDTASDAPRITYEFTATGPVQRVTDAGRDAAEGNDEVSAEDGSYTVSGVVGGGFGDTFRVTGEVVSFRTDADSAHLTLLADGEDVSDELLGESDARLFEVIADDSAPRFTYEFTVSGRAERVTDADENAAEPTNDRIERREDATLVSGVTGSGYGDAYRVFGTVSAFEASVEPEQYTLRLDGERVQR